MSPRTASFPDAVLCVGDLGINALATARALGRRGVPVQVFALETSAEVSSLSRYCREHTRVPDLADLYGALRALKVDLARRPVLFIDNDKMMKALAAHAAELQQRFRVVEPLAQAAQFMDKTFQLQAAAQAGIAVPRTWLPQAWEELRAIAGQSGARLLAKPSPVRFPAGKRPPFKALVAANASALERKLRARVDSPADFLVQEYIDGGDACHFGTMCYRARSRDAAFVVGTRKVRQTTLEAGIMAVGRLVDAPEVREMTRRLVESIGYYGVIHVEFKRSPHDGRYYFIEWNARPPYFHSVGWKAGFDAAWLAYCDHAWPQGLDAVRLDHRAGHYWINLEEDVKRFVNEPGLLLRPQTWAPYLAKKEWALLALDDPKPWAASMRRLAGWLIQRPARKLLGLVRRGKPKRLRAADSAAAAGDEL